MNSKYKAPLPARLEQVYGGLEERLHQPGGERHFPLRLALYRGTIMLRWRSANSSKGSIAIRLRKPRIREARNNNGRVVEMTLPQNNEQVFASKYMTVLPSKGHTLAFIAQACGFRLVLKSDTDRIQIDTD